MVDTNLTILSDCEKLTNTLALGDHLLGTPILELSVQIFFSKWIHLHNYGYLHSGVLKMPRKHLRRPLD